MLSRLVVLSVLLTAAAATPASGAPSPTAVRDALVVAHSPYFFAVGVRVGDERTVLLPGVDAGFSGRPLKVHPLSSPEEIDEVDEVEATSVTVGLPFAAVQRLTLAAPIPGAALPVADGVPALGDHVWVLRGDVVYRPGDEPELIETSVVARSSTSLTLGAEAADLQPGMPVVDAEGRILAVVAGYDRTALPVAPLLSEPGEPAWNVPLTPIGGLRFGADILGADASRFLLSIEAGVALWDQLAMAVRLGVGVSGLETSSLEPIDGFGPGVAETYELSTQLAFEAKYRALVADFDGFPVYLSPAAGFQLGWLSTQVEGLVTYGAAGCDPATTACPVTVREAPDPSYDFGYGPIFGLDLTFGASTIGYRYIPGALGHGLPEHTHQLTMGIGIF